MIVITFKDGTKLELKTEREGLPWMMRHSSDYEFFKFTTLEVVDDCSCREMIISKDVVIKIEIIKE